MRIPFLPHRSHDSQRGQSLLEFALVVPILLMLFAGAADFGRVFYSYVAIENAAKEGALYGARYPLCATATTVCPDPHNATWRTKRDLQVLGTAAPTPTVQCLDQATQIAHADLRDCVAGDIYVVRLSYQFTLITPILGDIIGNSKTLSTEARARVLNVAFDPTPGMAPVKLVDVTNATNRSEIEANCTPPEGVGSTYYRAPCVDGTGVTHDVKFQTGTTIPYRITVRNIGGTNLTSVTFSDSLGWPASCPSRPTTMAAGGAMYTCDYSRTAPSPASGISGPYENVLTVDSAQTNGSSDRAIVTVELPPAELQVLKYVSPYKEGSDGDGWIAGVASFGTDKNLTVSRVSGDAYAWFKIIVKNTGGQPATSVVITDSNGSLPYGRNDSTAVCDSNPSTIAAGAKFECRYRVTFSSDRVATNTVEAKASNVTQDSNDDSSATVTVQGCSGGNKVVPNLIGLSKSEAATAWGNAGFTGTITGNGTVVAQDRQAYACMAPTTTITISNAKTNS